MIGLAQIQPQRTAKCTRIWRYAARVPNAPKAINSTPNKWENGTIQSEMRLLKPIQTPRNTQMSASAQPVLAPKDPNKPSPQPKSP
jgi:hypothetical protein